ncbi:unnamed protein product [Schistosoma curassoni]|uniref:Protein kinase domain-containing protein n=1 Tax=Schistosoma curassoni TaxID=6186 RepID=A0A183KSX1_9TREM|nr:unnamed protein product [Schistosoma curassoni]
MWDWSAGCACILELMFTLGLETSTVRFKRHRTIYLAAESRYSPACERRLSDAGTYS